MMKILVQWIISLCLTASAVQAATIVADSVERSDVQAAVDASSAGDTVTVPAGTASWSEPVTINKAISVIGDGIGSTIINNTQGTGSGTPSSGAYQTFSVSLPDTGRVRISGFDIRMDGKAQGINVGGWNDTFYEQEIQIDDCRFYQSRGRAIYNNGLFKQLVFDCIFDSNFKTVDTYGGTGGTATDRTAGKNLSWNSPYTLGTTSQVVIEDNIFVYNSMPFYTSASATASHGFGSRAEWRFNFWTNNIAGKDFFPIIDQHGNQQEVTTAGDGWTLGSHRSGFQLAYYNNTHVSTVGSGTGSSYSLCQHRGGLGIYTSNTFAGTGFGSFQMREEDGINRFDFLGTYPGYDQHWVWVHDNFKDGVEAGVSYTDAETETIFVVEGVNLFLRLPEAGDHEAAATTSTFDTWTPLEYPHPWRTGGEEPDPEDPGEIQFSSAAYNVGEADGTVTITIQRVSGSDGEVTAIYTTTNATATAGSDYTLTTNTVTFADGVTTAQTFDVPITSDSDVEGDENFKIVLLSPGGGATLGSISETTVTIIDDDFTDPEDEIPLMDDFTFFQAEDGLIASPFESGNDEDIFYIRQPSVITVVTNAGLARFRFTVDVTGTYVLTGVFDAPDTSNNSLFVNIDGYPTGSEQIWHVPVTTGWQVRTSSWSGTGGSTNEFEPKTWELTAGEHTLYLRGREPVLIDSLGFQLYSGPVTPSAYRSKRSGRATFR